MARLARTMDILEEIILKNDRRKTKKPVDSDRRQLGQGHDGKCAVLKMGAI
jgi:hypothetical protein